MSKIEKMESILTKMEDLKNSQQSLIEKVGQIQVELFDMESKDLDAHIEKVSEAASNAFDEISEAIEEFEEKKNRLENE